MDASEAARALGRHRTQAWRDGRREAMTKLNQERHGALKPCTCGRAESPHAASCPQGHRERVAAYNKRKRERQQQPE